FSNALALALLAHRLLSSKQRPEPSLVDEEAFLGHLNQGLDLVAAVLKVAEALGWRSAGRPVEQLDGMDEGRLGFPELNHAAEIAGRDHIRVDLGDIGELALAQLVRELGLEQIVGTGRAAAEMAFGNLGDREAGLAEKLRGKRVDALAMLQGAGRVVGDL